MSSRYIEEIQDYATDAILRMVVALTKDEHIEFNESISTKGTKIFDEFYNEWIADLILIMEKKEVSDSIHYQDDYIRNDLYDFYTKYDITDGKQSNHVNFHLNDEGCGLIDAINLIVTQEFPEHSFDS